MILLLALVSHADPIAQRSPVDGDVVVVTGAPQHGLAVRLPADAGAAELVVSAGIRAPSAATDLSIGVRTRGGAEDRGWAWAAGASMGLLAVRGPELGLSFAPWARLERRGRVHGGLQVAAPIAGKPTGGLRIPVVGELFLGSQRGRAHIVAVGGAGWAFAPGTPAGALVAQGSVQLGLSFGRASEDAEGGQPQP